MKQAQIYYFIFDLFSFVFIYFVPLFANGLQMKIDIKHLKTDVHFETSLSLILDIRRAKDNGLYPIKYRVIHQRKIVYYLCNYEASFANWNELHNVPHFDGKLTKEKRALKEKYESLICGYEKINLVIKDLYKENGFTFDLLNKRLSKGTIDNVLDMFNEKVIRLKKDGKIGTSEWYYYASQQLLKYINDDKILNRKKTKKEQDEKPKYEKTIIKFSQVTPDWLRKYEKWLLECEKSYTSISMFIRALQAIFNDAKANGIITSLQYPFGKGKYERPEGEGRKLALTLIQISQLIKHPLQTETEKRCRDLWFFSYLANGINIGDLLRLKYSDIHDGEISYYRAKTIAKSKLKKTIDVIFLPEMQTIIDRWGNRAHNPENYIFPFFNDARTPEDEKRITKNVIKLMNTQLQRIAKDIGLPEISTYSARHSFATVLKRSGANIAFISESLGHSDLKTTENYLASFEKEERIKNANLLTQF